MVERYSKRIFWNSCQGSNNSNLTCTLTDHLIFTGPTNIPLWVVRWSTQDFCLFYTLYFALYRSPINKVWTMDLMILTDSARCLHVFVCLFVFSFFFFKISTLSSLRTWPFTRAPLDFQGLMLLASGPLRALYIRYRSKCIDTHIVLIKLTNTHPNALCYVITTLIFSDRKCLLST